MTLKKIKRNISEIIDEFKYYWTSSTKEERLQPFYIVAFMVGVAGCIRFLGLLFGIFQLDCEEVFLWLFLLFVLNLFVESEE